MPFTRSITRGDAFEIARRIVLFNAIHTLTHTSRCIRNRPKSRILQCHSRSLTRGDAFEIVNEWYSLTQYTRTRSLMSSKSPNEWYSSTTFTRTRSPMSSKSHNWLHYLTPFTRSLTRGDAFQIARRVGFSTAFTSARSPMSSKSSSGWSS